MHDDDCLCFGCKVRSVQLSPFATPSRLHPERAPSSKPGSWEAGVVRDSRGMPYLKSCGGEVHVKEWSERRHHYEGLLRQRANKTKE